MEMIQFSIGPLSGDGIDLQIPREGTVRDMLMKYVDALALYEVEARKCRFIFNTTLLRRRKSVRDIGLMTGSHVLVQIRSDEEVDSDSSKQESVIGELARIHYSLFCVVQ